MVTVTLYSQNYLIRYDAISVTINGVSCVSAFNGGIDIPRFQFADIEGFAAHAEAVRVRD